MAMVPRLFDARRARAGKPELLACVIALTTFPAAGQILMPGSSPGGGVRLFNSDAAILDAGEGKYHVDWLMRDRSERVCSHSWDAEATLPAKDKQMALDIAAGAVQPAETEPFKQEPPVQRGPNDPLNIKVVVNFAPQDS